MSLTFSSVKMLLLPTFTAVFISSVAVSWMKGVRTEKCQNATDLQKGLTCTFKKNNDICSWIVNDSSTPPLWTIDKGSKSFVVQMKSHQIVQLQSPKICPANGLSLLRFKYFSQNAGCEQSVFLVADSGNTQLCSTNKSTNNKDISTNITISNQYQEFKIVLQSRLHAAAYCMFKLGDTDFKTLAEGSGSILTSTVDGETSGCTLPGGESPGSGSLGSESLGGGLSGGGIAGIIVSLVIIIAVLVIVVFLLRRRKAGGKMPFHKLFGRLRTVIQTSTGSTAEAHTAERTNRPVIDGPYPEITSDSGHYLPKTKDYYSVPSDFVNGNNEGIKPEHGSHYAVSDVPESSNNYSIPRDEDDATRAPGGGKTSHRYVAEDDGGYSTPDDIDRLEDRQKTNTTLNARSGKKEAADNSYDKISFQPPRAGSSHKAADTYHHINPLEHADTGTGNSQDDNKEYKVPRSHDAEYSLATNPGDPYDRPPTTPTGITQKPDLTGKRGAPRANNADYNHLKLKDGGSPPVGATNAKGNGHGQVLYSHLEGQGQGDNYNRVDLDGRGGNKQTVDGSNPYNHLGD